MCLLSVCKNYPVVWQDQKMLLVNEKYANQEKKILQVRDLKNLSESRQVQHVSTWHSGGSSAYHVGTVLICSKFNKNSRTRAFINTKSFIQTPSNVNNYTTANCGNTTAVQRLACEDLWEMGRKKKHTHTQDWNPSSYESVVETRHF